LFARRKSGKKNGCFCPYIWKGILEADIKKVGKSRNKGVKKVPVNTIISEGAN
jgi:hypothetical protein